MRDIGLIVRIYLSAFSLAKIIRLAKKVLFVLFTYGNVDHWLVD